jgi:hypothetical protein
MERRYIDSAAQMVPVSAYASVALEECRRSADFMTGPKWRKQFCMRPGGTTPKIMQFVWQRRVSRDPVGVDYDASRYPRGLFILIVKYNRRHVKRQ